MNPVRFPQANRTYVAPPDLDDSQVMSIPAYHGPIITGSLDGECQTVVAWMPTAEELVRINAGDPIFLTFIGGLPPHYPSMSFQEATHPA